MNAEILLNVSALKGENKKGCSKEIPKVSKV